MIWKENKVVTVDIPYRGPGSSVRHTPVKFEIYFDGTNKYRAISQADAKTARLITIPAILNFEVNDGWVTCKNGDFDYIALEMYKAVEEKGNRR